MHKKIFRFIKDEIGIKYYLFLFLTMSVSVKNGAMLFCGYYGTLSLIDGISEKSSVYLIISFSVLVLSEFMGIIVNIVLNSINKEVEKNVYNRVIEKYSGFSLLQIMDTGIVQEIRDCQAKAETSFTSFLDTLTIFFNDFVYIIIYFFVCKSIGIWFYVCTLIGMFVVAVLMYKFKNKEENVYEKLGKLRDEKKYYDLLYRQEKNHAEIIAENATDYFSKRITDIQEKYIKNSIDIKRSQQKETIIENIVIGIFLCGSIVCVLSMVNSRNIGIEQGMTIIVAVILLYMQFKDIIDYYIYAKEEMYYIKKYFYLMDIKEDVACASDNTKTDVSKDIHNSKNRKYMISESSNNGKNEIKMENISFSYGKNVDNLVIKNLNLEIKKNDKILLIGENGSGKTTLLNILMGLYSQTSGEISLNECKDSFISNIKGRCASVSQDFPIIKGTIRENLFCVNAVEDDIKSALDKVDLLNVILSLENGWDTEIGDGMMLSKGQMQRLAIARLLLQKNKEIWVLDEPTSAMDALHEEKIMKTVLQEGKDKIIIIVTHRLGIAKSIDRIIHMSNGVIDYEGSHDELIDKEERYKKVYFNQAKMYS